MKICEILSKKEITLSFEVFPPKKSEDYLGVEAACEEIAKLSPDFMSITYGAGGGTSEYTANIAKELQDKYKVPMLPHLTCISSTKETVRSQLNKFCAMGFNNIMALRGDIPPEGSPKSDYSYAIDLIREIKEIAPELSIGGACYPDGHPEAKSKDEDIRHIKEKVEAGVSFLTTQMFFENSVYYNYLYRLREAGIKVPVLAGIMPITNKKQVERSIALSGTLIPNRFRALVDKFGDNPAAMKSAGVIYAAEQIADLIANGCGHIHVYTMNKPQVAREIMGLLKDLL